MKIYTRKGDGGHTRLYGGAEVSKSDPRVDAYGTVDELNATLGVVLSLDPDDRLGTRGLREVQEDLFVVGSRLAAARPERELARGTIPSLSARRIEEIEAWIDRLDDEVDPLTSFILPGGSEVGAQLHVARTVCRRAERAVVALLEADPALNGEVVPYINRLSDLLFTLARAVNHRDGRPETKWQPARPDRAAEPGAATGEVEDR